MNNIEIAEFVRINSFPAEDTHSFIEMDCMSVEKVLELLSKILPAPPKVEQGE